MNTLKTYQSAGASEITAGPLKLTIAEVTKPGAGGEAVNGPDRQMIVVKFKPLQWEVPHHLFRHGLTVAGTRVRPRGKYDGAIVYVDADDGDDIFAR